MFPLYERLEESPPAHQNRRLQVAQKARDGLFSLFDDTRTGNAQGYVLRPHGVYRRSQVIQVEIVQRNAGRPQRERGL